MSLSHEFFGCPRRQGGQRVANVSHRRRSDGCPPSEDVRRPCLLSSGLVEQAAGEGSRAGWLVLTLGAVAGVALGAGIAWRTAIAPISGVADVLGSAVETIDLADPKASAGPQNRFYRAQSSYARDSVKALRVPGSVPKETLAAKRGEALRRLGGLETRGGM